MGCVGGTRASFIQATFRPFLPIQLFRAIYQMDTLPPSSPPPEVPEPPPLHLRQRAMLLMVFLLALMLALPFFLMGWGLRGHLHPSVDSELTAPAVDKSNTDSLREVLESSDIFPPPEPLIEEKSIPRFPEWRPAVSPSTWTAWQEFLQVSAAVRLEGFTENGMPWQQYLIRTEAMPAPPEPPPPFSGPVLVLVLPAAPPEIPAAPPSP